MPRPPLWPTILSALGIFILCSLGTWQLHRLEWKTKLLSDIAAQKSTFRQFNITDLAPENVYQSGEIEGRFLYDKELRIIPRTAGGKVGAHLITPLLLNNGQTLLVNRGWIPADYQDPPQPQAISPSFHVAGMIRTPEKPNMFIPANAPETDQWYSFDIAAMAKAKALDNILPVLFYEIDLTNGAHSIVYPDANALTLNIPNNHLQYALFWFAMAGVLLLIYILRFVKKSAA